MTDYTITERISSDELPDDITATEAARAIHHALDVMVVAAEFEEGVDYYVLEEVDSGPDVPNAEGPITTVTESNKDIIPNDVPRGRQFDITEVDE